MSRAANKFTDLPRVHPAVYNTTTHGTRAGRPRQQTKCGHKGCNASFSLTCRQNQLTGIKNFTKAALAKGWTFDQKRDRFVCPDHSPTEEPMSTKAAEPTITPTMRRSIFRAIDEAYDEKAQCYAPGVTDQTIASEVNTTWGWVARIREENFGPAGPDPKIAKILEEIEKVSTALLAVETEAMQAAEKAENLGKALTSLKARVEALT